MIARGLSKSWDRPAYDTDPESDYYIDKARLQLESQARAEQLPDLEDYDYPGRLTDRSRGKHLAQRTLERHRSDYHQATAHNDQPTLRSGHFLELAGHPRTSWKSTS